MSAWLLLSPNRLVPYGLAIPMFHRIPHPCDPLVWRGVLRDRKATLGLLVNSRNKLGHD